MNSSERTRHSVWVALSVTLVVGCRSGAADTPEPIPECESYERAFAHCLGQGGSVSIQGAALAGMSAEDRDRLRSLCVTNLQRIQEACR
jgi:hypothetical protein